MGVIAGQQPRLLSGQPALDLEPRTWRTQSVPTGVVPDAFDMPLRAGLDVAPQARGATGQQRPYCLPYLGRQRVARFKPGIAALEDLLDGHLSHVRYPQSRTPVPRSCGLVQLLIRWKAFRITCPVICGGLSI